MNRTLKTLAGGSAAIWLVAVAMAPARAWGNLLLASYGLVCVGLAGVFFVALQYACGAGWSVAFRRVPEAMPAILPFGAAGLAATFLLRPALYPWTSGGHAANSFQAGWLTLPFFLARAAVYLAVWMLLAALIVRASRAQDPGGEVRLTRNNVRLSVIFLVVFAVTFWLASYDWVMSLEPHWASTIFGVYNFAGMFSSGLAVLILLVLWMRRAGPLRDFVTEEHLHDLGKLLFAFCTFWMYIWFSQYMLIWYADITEETTYFVRRQHELWQPLFFLNVVLNWGVPFLVLLPQKAKRSPGVLAKVAVVVLLGRWLDLYQMILPPIAGTAPHFGLPEIAPVACAGALFLLVFKKRFDSAPPVPVGDPYLEESLHYHN